eukprot:scaffold40295_cov46-Attheya_sp.AAC.2
MKDESFNDYLDLLVSNGQASIPSRFRCFEHTNRFSGEEFSILFKNSILFPSFPRFFSRMLQSSAFNQAIAWGGHDALSLDSTKDSMSPQSQAN